MIELKCPNCNADIELDDSRELGFCRYCGTKILIEPNKSKVDGIAGVDNLLLRAEQFLKENNLEKASEYFNRVLDVDFNNSRAKQGISEVQKKSQIALGDTVRATVVDETGRSYIGCIIVRLENGQEIPLPVANISPNISKSNIRNGEKFILTCDNINNGVPSLVSEEVKKIREKGKNMSFVDELTKENTLNDTPRMSCENRLVNDIISAIKKACKANVSVRKIEGIYSGSFYGEVTQEIIEMSEHEADKRATPQLKRRGRSDAFPKIIKGEFNSTINIELLSKYLDKEISALGFRNYHFKFIPISNEEMIMDGLMPKRTFGGDIKFKLTGDKSYDFFVKIEW